MPETTQPTNEQTLLDRQTGQLSGAIGNTVLLTPGLVDYDADAIKAARRLADLSGRSPEWLTDGLDEGNLKQVRVGKGDRYQHVDIADNPIETGYPLGDLVSIVQVGERNAYVWRINDEGSAQFTLTDDTFSLTPDGEYEGWWTPLVEGQEISLSSEKGDDSGEGFDIQLIGHKDSYEMAARNRGDDSARVIRAESREEIEEKQQAEERKARAEKQEEEARLHWEWLETQKFDNFVDFKDYDSFLVTAVEHYLRTPERTGSKELGAKYVEVHINGDGETFIIPAPRGMVPYGATTDGHHSIVDELRMSEGYDNFPNYMKFVNERRLDTGTVKSKGYLRKNDEGQLVLELSSNRGTWAERQNFTWLDESAKAAKKAGIDRVVLDDFSTKELLEIDLDSEAERQVRYYPETDHFSDPELKSPSLTVGVLEDVLVERGKTVKSGRDENASLKKVREIKLEGSEAGLKLHGPLIDRIAQRRADFKNTAYPLAVQIDGGAVVDMAITYQFDSQNGEFGISFRYATPPPEAFAEIQHSITEKILDNFALRHAGIKSIAASVATSVGAARPDVRPAQVANPHTQA